MQMQKHQDFLNRRFRRRRGFVLEFWNLGGEVHDVWVQVTNLQIHNCRYTDKPSKPANQEHKYYNYRYNYNTTKCGDGGDGLWRWAVQLAVDGGD